MHACVGVCVNLSVCVCVCVSVCIGNEGQIRSEKANMHLTLHHYISVVCVDIVRGCMCISVNWFIDCCTEARRLASWPLIF